MKVSYYPGCSLHGTGREYAESTEAVFKSLGTELVEIEDWNCCGASSGHSRNRDVAVGLPARNLLLAKKSGFTDMVIPCSACFQRTKVAEHELKNHPEMFPEIKYDGGVHIMDIVTFVSENIGIDTIKKKIKKHLDGLKAVTYYGCLTMRHPSITGSKDFENPRNMDALLTALGIDVLDWSYKTDCCGGSLVLTRPDIVWELSGRLYDKAIEAGAECIVTLCPLCQGNLDQQQAEISKKNNRKYNLPVFYFTELMGLAMGEGDVNTWFKRHLVDPTALLKSKKFL